MSLTCGFVNDLRSKPLERVIGPQLSDVSNFVAPRIQIISLDEHPSISALRELGLPPSINLFGTHGLQWLTISDGNHSIQAVLENELKPLVTKGSIKANTVVDIIGYVILKDPNTPSLPFVVNIGLLDIFQTDFPDRIGNPQNIFEAAENVRRVTLNPTLSKHPLLHLTRGVVDSIRSGDRGCVYLAKKDINLKAQFIHKVQPGVWHMILTDGVKTVKGVASKNLEWDKMGAGENKFKANLSEWMTESEGGLKVGDIISVPEYMTLEEDKKKVMLLNHVVILHRA